MTKNPEFMGLPIPTTDEYAVLQNRLFDDSIDGMFVDELSMAVNSLVPNIRRVEMHDMTVWKDTECDVDYSDQEAEHFTYGISAGYDFVVACFTQLAWLRSDARDLDEYLNMAPNLVGGLPVLSEVEFNRVKAVRAGKALIDNNNKKRDIEDSRGLAAHDAIQYLMKSPQMGYILYNQKQLIFHNSDPNSEHPVDSSEFKETQAYVDGYYHGFQNAIEMYIQSFEEQNLQSIEENIRWK